MQSAYISTYQRAKRTLEDYLYHQIYLFLNTYGVDLLPTRLDTSHIEQVLDVACGSGDWALELAYTYPGISITGLDLDVKRIDYAKAQAKVQGFDNITFVTGDMYSLQLPEDFYDLVHGRFLSPVIIPQSLQELLNELMRVCRPEGTIVLTEALYPDTCSAAGFRYCDLFRQAIELSGYSTDIVKNVELMLYLAGCQHVQRIITPINISYGTQAHMTLCMKARDVLDFTMPFLLHKGVVTAAQFEDLRNRIIDDLIADYFVGSWSIITILGQK